MRRHTLQDATGVYLTDDEGNFVFAQGDTVPASATSGYAKGCIFLDTDAAAGAMVWINEGTNTSSTFVELVSRTATLTLTNKTLTSPTITAPTFTGQGTGYRRPVQIFLTEATETLTAAQAGKIVIATKASATQTFTLPIATTAGMEFIFICGDAGGEILVTPNAADTMLIKATEDAGASVSTAAGAGIKNTAATNVLGDHIHLISDGVSKWYMIGQSGIWGAQ